MFLQNVAFFSPRTVASCCSKYGGTGGFCCLFCISPYRPMAELHSLSCCRMFPKIFRKCFLMFLSHSTIYFSNITKQFNINSFYLLLLLFTAWVPVTIFSTRDLSICFAFLHLHSFSQKLNTLLQPFSSKPLAHGL